MLAAVVYETYTPGQPEFSWSEVWAAWFCLAALLMFLGRMLVRRRATGSLRQARLWNQALEGAFLALLLILITFLDLKALLWSLDWWPVYQTPGALALALLFFAHLALAWWTGHPLSRTGGPPASVVAGQIRYAAPVVFPWLILAFVSDSLQFFWPGLQQWLNTPWGDGVRFAVFLSLLAVLFPPLMKFWWGCKPLQGPARDLAAQVMQKSGVKVADILNWPLLGGRALTAGILGLVPALRYLLVTTRLLETLQQDELEAVVAHEAAHVRYRHLWWYLFFFLGYFICVYALFEPLAIVFDFLRLHLTNWDSPAGAKDIFDLGFAGVLAALPVLLLLIIYVRFVMGFFIRNFERQADFYAWDFMGRAEPLQNALEKIALAAGGARQEPSWHHFSIAQRVEAMNSPRPAQGAAKAQGRKIKKGLLCYVAGLALVTASGLAMQAYDLGQGLQAQVRERYLAEQLEQAPRDPQVRMVLGLWLWEQGRTEQALQQLRLAHDLAPQDPQIMNNLAWVLLTCPEEHLRDLKLGRQLALTAVSLAPQAHIWDTVAEAYWRNHDPLRAIAAAQAALKALPPDEDQTYFQEQLAKFKHQLYTSEK